MSRLTKLLSLLLIISLLMPSLPALGDAEPEIEPLLIEEEALDAGLADGLVAEQEAFALEVSDPEPESAPVDPALEGVGPDVLPIDPESDQTVDPEPGDIEPDALPVDAEADSNAPDSDDGAVDVSPEPTAEAGPDASSADTADTDPEDAEVSEPVPENPPESADTEDPVAEPASDAEEPTAEPGVAPEADPEADDTSVDLSDEPARAVGFTADAERLLVGVTYPLSQLMDIGPDEAVLAVEIEDTVVAGYTGPDGIVARAVGSTAVAVTLTDGATVCGTLTVIDAETASILEELGLLAAQYASGSGGTVSIASAGGLNAVQGKEYAWTSLPICPDFTLTYNGRTLVKNQDYGVQYRNNVNPGTAGILIVGLGTFTGTCTATFRIQAKPSVYLKPEKLTIGVGEIYSLACSGANAKFMSSKPSVVAVNSAGMIKGLKKGSATISMATSDGKVLSCAVTVKAKPTKVKLSATKLTLGVGQGKALTAKLKPSGCRGGVTWTSSDASVAAVEGGSVIALKSGTATITASTYNGKKAKCTVTVKAAPTAVTLNRTEANLNVKGKTTLKLTVSPAGALAAGSFSSSDTSVATINSKGKITGKKAGKAVITVKTYNGQTAQCAVTVWTAPKSVALDQKKASMAVNATLQLTTAVSPASANPAVTWSSSNKKVATVSATGLVTAVKAGTVKITAKTSNGKKATCKITVWNPPTSITVKAAKTTLYVGEYTMATATLNKNAFSDIEWYADGSAVTVSQSGRIDAVEAGTATVYARATAASGVIGKVTIVVNDVTNTKGAIIDISKWQGTIDFKSLKPAVSFVIARGSCGTTIDSMINTYAAGMNAQKIPFGVYCYSKASTAEEAQLEARALFAYTSKYNPKFYVMDAEEGCITKEAILAFVAELRSLGAKKVGAYVGHHRYTQYGVSSIKSKLDFVWIPRYGKNDGTIAGATKPDYACDLWQFTSMGKVPGISGRVDMNVLTGTGRSLSWFVS